MKRVFRLPNGQEIEAVFKLNPEDARALRCWDCKDEIRPGEMFIGTKTQPHCLECAAEIL